MKNKLKIETLSCQIQINSNKICGGHRSYCLNLDTVAVFLEAGISIPDYICINGRARHSFVFPGI